MCLAKMERWSTHSRRIELISRSAKPFCHGEAGATGLSGGPFPHFLSSPIRIGAIGAAENCLWVQPGELDVVCRFRDMIAIIAGTGGT